MKNVAFTLVMLPPHTSVRRNWAARVAQDEIGVRVLQPETIEDAVRDIAEADAAFGTMPPEVLRAARRLRWLQAPQSEVAVVAQSPDGFQCAILHL
jgi:phosphoglycerate dehydrogenase-like enzyme